MILKAIALAEYQAGVHKLPQSVYDLKPGQFVVLTYDGTGSIVVLFQKDVPAGYPIIGMGLVLQSAKRFKGALLAKSGNLAEVEEIWIVEDDGTALNETNKRLSQRSFLDAEDDKKYSRLLGRLFEAYPTMS